VRFLLAVALLLAPAAAHATLYTNTSQVEALAADGDTLWVGTRGGLEVWEVTSLTRRRLYTTDDGLADNQVLAISVVREVRVRTASASCVLAGARWRCRPQPSAAPRPGLARMFAGHRVTAEVRVGERAFVGTAGAGVWLAPARRLTPEDQICSNSIVALARFAGQVWYGSFDEGLCSFDGRHFSRAALPAAMINDLLAEGGLLYVATTRGLFFSDDGRRFRAVRALGDRPVVDLASDGRTLWAVTTVSLWRLPLHPGCGVPRSQWQPGGSHALQAVDVAGGTVWIATEDRGLLRQAGPRFEVFDRAAGLPSSWSVDVAATRDGGAFAATLRDGLVRIEPDGRVRPMAVVLDPWLLHVSVAGATVWVGTQGGAAAIVDGMVAPLGGLPHPSVHALLPTPDGLWVATEGGTALR
jgi:ligand-binding sensor domain-containing protein